MLRDRRGFNGLVDTRYGLMLCNRFDVYVSGSLQQYGEYSELEAQYLRRLVPLGGVVLQAGAHIGSLTIPLALAIGPNGMLIAFEPQRLAYQCLVANVALQSLEHVVCENMAVGGAHGVAVIPHHDPYQHYNTGGVRINESAEGEAVRVLTLDSYIDPPRLDLIHADVESMEAEVIRGSEQLVRKHRPVLYVECIDDDKRPELVGLMRSLGYTVWHHKPPMYNPLNYAGNPVNMVPGIASHNIVGWPIERLEQPPRDQFCSEIE